MSTSLGSTNHVCKINLNVQSCIANVSPEDTLKSGVYFRVSRRMILKVASTTVFPSMSSILKNISDQNLIII